MNEFHGHTSKQCFKRLLERVYHLSIQKEYLGLLIIFTGVYFLSHGFLLVASGRWWDDWVFYNQNMEVLTNMGIQLGRPSIIFIIQFAKLFSESGYRIITFIMFYCIALFLWGILRNTLNLSNRACLFICLLQSTLPANDVRILLSVFPYTIGLFFFGGGFYLFSYILNESRQKNWILRIASLLLFFVSFTLNSCLVMYAIPLLYIFYHEKKISKMVCYLDYIAIPFIYFIAKGIFFPAFGVYENYNSLTLAKLFYAIKNILQADIEMIKNVFIAEIYYFPVALAIVIMAFFFCNFMPIGRRKGKCLLNEKQAENRIGKKDSLKTRVFNVKLAGIGIITLSVALFSYVAVRGESTIPVSGIGGRDSVLVPLGLSILLYAIIEFIFKKNGVTKYVYGVIIVAGIIYFNSWYLSYQKDYYRQLGFQLQLMQHEELEVCKNIVYLTSDGPKVDTTAFYALNGNAEVAYGNQNRLIMYGFQGISLLNNEKLWYFVESGNYHMTDYDMTYKYVDAIIEYSNPISTVDAIKLKFKEFFAHEEFEAWLHANSDLKVMLAGSEEYEQRLMEAGYEAVIRKE